MRSNIWKENTAWLFDHFEQYFDKIFTGESQQTEEREGAWQVLEEGGVLEPPTVGVFPSVVQCYTFQ